MAEFADWRKEVAGFVVVLACSHHRCVNCGIESRLPASFSSRAVTLMCSDSLSFGHGPFFSSLSFGRNLFERRRLVIARCNVHVSLGPYPSYESAHDFARARILL